MSSLGIASLPRSVSILWPCHLNLEKGTVQRVFAQFDPHPDRQTHPSEMMGTFIFTAHQNSAFTAILLYQTLKFSISDMSLKVDVKQKMDIFHGIFGRSTSMEFSLPKNTLQRATLGGLKATGAAGACGFIRVLFVVFFGSDADEWGYLVAHPANRKWVITPVIYMG